MCHLITAGILLLSFHNALSVGSCGLPPPPASKPLGSLATRPSLLSPPSLWSVGGETLDRGFTNFSSWSPYLGLLGASSVRLQAGWARCEPHGGGVYAWAWLDEAVNGSLGVGVEPWLQLSFGNPNYEGGGTASVGSPLPSGALALAAWDAWVRGAVMRYAPTLRDGGVWEIWNEPNIQHINASAYASFALRTAGIIRSVAPAAIIRVGVVAGADAYYAALFAAAIALVPGGGALLNQFTYHPYDYNPDTSYPAVAKLRAALDAGGLGHLTLVQGENGAPSIGGGYGALTDYNWTECTQAKWFARRLLGDSARGIPSSAFSMVDLCYEGAGGAVEVNHKGLLEANCTAPGYPVLRPKASYAAVQHVFGALDGTFTALPQPKGIRVDLDAACTCPSSALFAGAWVSPSGELLFALWNASGTPLNTAPLPSSSSSSSSSAPVTCSVNLTLLTAHSPPRVDGAAAPYAGVDIVSGTAFSVAGGPLEVRSSLGSTVFAFQGVPIGDTPLLLAPINTLRLVPPPPSSPSPPPPFSLGVGTNLGNTLEAPGG